ncbi:MAG: KH domain-containing protein [Acidimicrobiales bacterium]
MTDLYEAGDINQTDGPGDDVDDEIDDDINDEIDDEVDEVDDDVDDDEVDDDDDIDEGVGEGNELGAADGGTPLTVLTYLARSLSNDPDAVVIDTEERRNGVRLSLHVAPEDMGRVIGRRGRTAQAIRTLVNVAGAKDGAQASVDIVDD